MSEINQAIGTLLHWHVEQGTDPEHPTMHCLINSEGEIEYHSTDAEFAWDGASDWEHLLDASVGILPEDIEITLHVQGGLKHATLNYRQGTWIFMGHSETDYAAALAEASLKYLQWKAQVDPQGEM